MDKFGTGLALASAGAAGVGISIWSRSAEKYFRASHEAFSPTVVHAGSRETPEPMGNQPTTVRVERNKPAKSDTAPLDPFGSPFSWGPWYS